MTALPTSQAGRPSSSLHYAVGELSGKVDQILMTILPQITDLKAADEKLSTRLSTLETLMGRWQYGFLGFITVGGFLWAVIEQAPTILALVKVTHQ